MKQKSAQKSRAFPSSIGRIKKGLQPEGKALPKKKMIWQSVVVHLENYTVYANLWRSYCIKMVNAEPPPHSEKDKKLLQRSQSKTDPAMSFSATVIISQNSSPNKACHPTLGSLARFQAFFYASAFSQSDRRSAARPSAGNATVGRFDTFD